MLSRWQHVTFLETLEWVKTKSKKPVHETSVTVALVVLGHCDWLRDSDGHGAVSMASPSHAADVGLFMQWRSLNFMVLEDEELHSDQSSQSDQATSLLPGDVVENATAELMEIWLIDCFLPVFLYWPVTMQPFGV